jgi:hypothetical protein
MHLISSLGWLSFATPSNARAHKEKLITEKRMNYSLKSFSSSVSLKDKNKQLVPLQSLQKRVIFPCQGEVRKSRGEHQINGRKHGVEEACNAQSDSTLHV